jgi:outer membrane PBP1 activator LpoA protein
MNRARQAAAALPALLAALWLGGCAVFAPAFDPVLDEKTTAAYESVATLAAEVELGKYEDKATYDAAGDRYATINGLLSVAVIRADTLPVSGKPAEAARDALTANIRGCRDQVTGLAQVHKLDGLKAGSGATAAMMASCDMAARAARMMKPEG